MGFFTALWSRRGRTGPAALLSALLLLPFLGVGQTVIFNESFGTPTATTGITAYASGTSPATYSTKPLGYIYSSGGATNPSDIRATSGSSGYTGASGSGNTFFTSTNAEYGFAIGNINTSSFTNLTLSFGLRKEAATAFTLIVDYSTDGTTFTPIAVSGLPSASAVANWYGITGVAVPAGAQSTTLTLRFRKQGITGLRVDDIILRGTSGTPTPTLTVTPTSLTGFTYVVGSGPSAAQSYNLSGSNLTPAAGDLTATAPTNYEVALTSTGTYAATQTVAYTGSTLAATPIFVRLKSGLAANSYTGNVVNSGGGAADANVALTGSVTAGTTAPTVATTAASAITATTATSGGNVSADGGASVTARGIVYSLSTGPQLGGAGVTQVADAPGTGTGTFPSSLTGLSPATTYYVRAYATNSVGTSYGSEITFLTLPAPVAPTVTTAATTAITATTATSGGNVTTDGGATVSARGVVYSLSATPRLGGAGVTAVPGGTGTGSFTSSLTGLTASTTYFVAAYATNSVGTSYGADVTFTTTAPAATPLLAYDFLTGVTPSTQDPNVTGSAFTRVGVASNAGAARFNSTGWATTTTADPTKYVQFNFAPNSGYQATLTSLSFINQRSSTGPTSFEVRSSVDAFTAALLTGTVTGTTANTPVTALLSGPGFTNVPAGPGVTFRFYAYNSSGGTYSVDEVQLFGTVSLNNAPLITANPTTLTFAATTGQPAATQTYTLGAANLPANTVITISSSDPAVLVSLTGGASFAQTATATTSASGSLSQVVTVQFTGPATAGTTTASITNTDGTRTATVAVTGTTTVPPAPTISSFAPISGPVGTVVTITGTGFVAGTTVAFNGTAATVVTVVSATSIQATVPTGTTTGTISVSNANGTATSTGIFTVTTPAPVLAAGYLLLEDDFNYVAGTRLPDNGWAAHGSPSGGDAPTVVAANLTSATYPTGPLSPDANKVLVNGVSTDVNRGFTAPAGSNTLYYSVLLSIPTVNADATDYFLHLLERAVPAQNFRARLFARPGTTAGTYNLGVSVAATLPAAAGYTTAEYTAGQTYLAVVKYVYTPSGSADAVSLFVFDNTATLPATEPATPSAGPVTESTAPSVPNGMAIRQASSGSGASLSKTPVVNLDGIRVATGWATVVGNPTYTEPTATINAGNYYRLTVNGTGTQLAPVGAVNVENELVLTNGLINTTATNALTLYQGATVSGGSATSFVNGPLARGTGPVEATTFFPIGKGTAYRPLTLTSTAQTSTTTYTGEIFNASARTSGLDGGLTRVSNIRYATVAPVAQPTGFSGTLTMAFGLDDFVNYPQDNSFVMAKRDGGNWQNIGRTSATGIANNGQPVSGDLTSGVFTSFSDFSLASTAPASNNALDTSNPLPVQLSSFSAQRQPDNAVAVKWATASERNSARFEVQRSTGGQEFSTIATVAAVGNSSQPTIYAALDKTAPAATTLYYRLRQVDRDGSFAFSPVAVVAGSSVATKVLLYPNPAHSRLNFLAAAPTPYRVLNQLGQPLLRGTTEAGTASIGIETLAPGLYFLELQTAVGRTVQKFEKY